MPDAAHRLAELIGRAIPARAGAVLLLGDTSPARTLEAARPGLRVGTLSAGALPLAGSQDCLVLVGGLPGMPDPAGLLRKYVMLVRAGGVVVAAVANAGHHARVAALLTGDVLPGVGTDELTWQGLFRLLLDAGLVPRALAGVREPLAEDTWQALRPACVKLRHDPERARAALEASHHVVTAGTLSVVGAAARPVEPLSFVVCVNDRQQLRANLLGSPCLGPGSPHEVLAYANCPSAAAGLNAGLREARHERVVCLHQDVYLPPGWDRAFVAAWDAAEARLGRAGVVGVYGVRLRNGQVERAGHVVDRERLLREQPALPAPVDTLDELLLGVRRRAGLVFEPAVGFHFYGADLCLQARARGLQVLALDALCWHNSRSVGLPPDFGTSAAAFAARWRGQLPVATACVLVGTDGSWRVA